MSLHEHWFSFLMGKYLVNGIVGSYGKYWFNFLKNCRTILEVAIPFCISTSNV